MLSNLKWTSVVGGKGVLPGLQRLLLSMNDLSMIMPEPIMSLATCTDTFGLLSATSYSARHEREPAGRLLFFRTLGLHLWTSSVRPVACYRWLQTSMKSLKS
jgi:hypothetical protein